MSNASISLPGRLVDQVRQVAEAAGSTVEDFVDRAVQERIARLADEKLTSEAYAFEQLHPRLVEQYLGQFVAVHAGEVVDSAADFESLFLRVQKQFGETAVLIRLVGATPKLELRGPTPTLERGQTG